MDFVLFIIFYIYFSKFKIFLYIYFYLGFEDTTSVDISHVQPLSAAQGALSILDMQGLVRPKVFSVDPQDPQRLIIRPSKNIDIPPKSSGDAINKVG